MANAPHKVRLLRKTSKTFLLTSFVVMILSTIVLYFYVSNLLQNEIEEELRSTEARIESALLETGSVFQLPPVAEVTRVTELLAENLKDTLIFDPSQNELEEFREFTTYSAINGEKYRITVRALIVESESILIAVVASYLIIILLVFIFLFYMNKAGNQKVWSPFFDTLNQIKHFSLGSDSSISLMDSDVLEFSELNDEISNLTNKVRSDYKNLKQYTEDVSHEMQTPLAIIQAKIENIINGDNLNEVQYEHLTSIQQDIQRLTQMNKRLALLTKIENNQFVNPESLNLNSVLERRIRSFNEIYAAGITWEEQGRIKVKMDAYLADVLCDNLLSNALKYSGKEESIAVCITDTVLSVSNDGEEKLKNPQKLFSRFYRETDQVKSTGLGLAIVQKICDFYDFEPSYSYKDGKHIFNIQFPQKRASHK